jgi:hypothetical protein
MVTRMMLVVEGAACFRLFVAVSLLFENSAYSDQNEAVRDHVSVCRRCGNPSIYEMSARIARYLC